MPFNRNFYHDEWYVDVVRMKLQCFIVIISLIKEFTRKFLNQDLINVIGIIYH
jgi:hypothetical protein